MRGPRPNRRYLPKALRLYESAWSCKAFLFARKEVDRGGKEKSIK